MILLGAPATAPTERSQPVGAFASQTATTSAPARAMPVSSRRREGPGAGDRHPRPGQRVLPLEQRLHPAGRHHSGQLPARHRQLPILPARAEHQPLRQHRLPLPLRERGRRPHLDPVTRSLVVINQTSRPAR